MTPDKAIELQDKIKALCQEHNVWISITHENRPDLTMIRGEFSIKVQQMTHVKFTGHMAEAGDTIKACSCKGK